jgi:general secretion pathway protein I
VKSQRGFSLLEAVVAITLLSISGGALFAWVNTMLTSVTRVEAVSEQYRVVEQSLALLEDINPMAEPSGRRQLGEYSVQWRSTLAEDARDSVNRYGIRGLYEVGLFYTDVIVEKSERTVSDFRVKQVGYRQVRQADE